MSDTPLVSVIIPVHNCESYLAEAIESVRVQTYSPVEVIVIDDGSTDGSAEIVCFCEDIHMIRQENQGVASARNRGLTAAKGEFIAFLDGDDIWPASKLQVQIDYLMKHPDADVVIGHIENFLESGVSSIREDRDQLLKPGQVGLMTMVGRREVFRKVGDFDPAYRVGSDFEWFARAKDAGIKKTILPDVVLRRRVHGNNLSLNKPQVSASRRLQIFKESIDRQRKQNKEI